MDKEVRIQGEVVVLDDDTRAKHVAAIRRVADAIEAKKDDEVAFVFSASHKEDNGEAVTALWGPTHLVHTLAQEAVKQTMPDELREALSAIEAGVDPRKALAEAKAKLLARVSAEKVDAVALPRGLNPDDVDAAELAN